MKTLKFKTFSVLFAITAIINFSFAQKVTTAEFLEDHPIENSSYHKTFDDIVKAISVKDIKSGKLIKGVISDENPIMLVEGDKNFPSPYTIFKLTGVKEGFELEFISLGNMGGFKKTIMFPLVSVYNESGEKIEEIEIKNYETRSPDMKLPFHLYSFWKINIKDPGNYYILISSDNSSTDDIALHASKSYALATGVGLLERKMLKGYPVKRSPYGKYKLTIK